MNTLPIQDFLALFLTGAEPFKPFSDLAVVRVVTHGGQVGRAVLHSVPTSPLQHSAVTTSFSVSLTDTPAAASQVLAEVLVDEFLMVTSVSKAVCNTCSFLVAVRDHHSRCVPVTESTHRAKVSSRALAWVGDALLTLDVRMCLLLAGEPLSRVQQLVSTLTSNVTLANLYDEYVPVVYTRVPALGPSVRQRATAFEASYAGAFRRHYLQSAFGRTPDELARCLSRFYTDDSESSDPSGAPLGSDMLLMSSSFVDRDSSAGS